MNHFHQLQVKHIKRETADCVSITFDVPTDLNNIFRYKQGQNLTIRTILDGEEKRRNYSICSSPLDNTLRIAIKKVPGGAFSTYANEVIKKGDILEVMPPTGSFFTELHKSNKKNYLAFAAGSGITPLLSVIKTTLLTEPLSFFTLVYGNQSKTSIIFKEELEALKDRFLSRFQLIHILSREKSDNEINSGRIDTGKLTVLFDKVIKSHIIDEVFLCGPSAMIACVQSFLAGKGLEKKKIHFELFAVPGIPKPSSRLSAKPEEVGLKSRIDIRIDNTTIPLDLNTTDNSILDAALSQGLPLPFACKGGICSTCKAKLLSGKVRMDASWGLEPDEIEAGFILTCQSHPETDYVSIDFDAT